MAKLTILILFMIISTNSYSKERQEAHPVNDDFVTSFNLPADGANVKKGTGWFTIFVDYPSMTFASTEVAGLKNQIYIVVQRKSDRPILTQTAITRHWLFNPAGSSQADGPTIYENIKGGKTFVFAQGEDLWSVEDVGPDSHIYKLNRRVARTLEVTATFNKSLGTDFNRIDQKVKEFVESIIIRKSGTP